MHECVKVICNIASILLVTFISKKFVTVMYKVASK